MNKKAYIRPAVTTERLIVNAHINAGSGLGANDEVGSKDIFGKSRDDDANKGNDSAWNDGLW